MLEKELEDIVLKEQDIIPFLKKLNQKERRSLAPFLQKFRAKIFETYHEVKKTKWGDQYTTKYHYSEAKRLLVDKACFVCFNKTETKKGIYNINQLLVNEQYLDEIIPWYIPSWYSDLMNEEMPWQLDYEKMMAMTQKTNL